MSRKGTFSSRGARLGLVAACTAVATFGVMTGAQALWGVNDAVVISPMLFGGVSFAAGDPADPATLDYSPDGGAVSVTLPAAEIIKVLSQKGLDAEPIIWRFEATGWGDGITGLVYDLSVVEQVRGSTDKPFGLAEGVAEDGTILHYTTTKVYPASVNGSCSPVPATPVPVGSEDAKDIYVFEMDDEGNYVPSVDDEGNYVPQATGHVLQNPGARSEDGVTQIWCVAMDFNNADDGLYVNDAQATGIGEDNSLKGALDTWTAPIAFPPSLPAAGEYYNKAYAWGTADDLTIARDEDEWRAPLYPDPNQEPSVTITLDPAVTNQNPNVEQPSDDFALSDDS